VPDRPIGELAGLRHADLAPFGQVQMTVIEAGEGFVRTAVEQHGARLIPGTDTALLAEGYATLSAIRPPSLDSRVELPHPRLDTPADQRH
jgi:5'-nucleotidase